jgi:hypothetical protein
VRSGFPPAIRSNEDIKPSAADEETIVTRISKFGEIVQLAYVPSDFDGALRFWTEEVGAGPLFVRDIVLKGWRYRGETVDIPITVALGYWGDSQIELIRPTDQTPSIYRDWRAAGREGLQHFGIVCHDGPGARAALAEAGFQVVQEVDGPTGGMFYAEKPGSHETMLEFLCLTDAQRDYFAMMREAHRTWDGRDPIR